MQKPKIIILASKSPRRKDLLQSIGLNFEIHPSNFEEKSVHLTPKKLVLHNAKGKAEEIAKHHKNAIIIGVDTVGAYKEHILNKPKNKADAKRMLKTLSGTTHKVVSGIHIIDTETGKSLSGTETTLVTMDKLKDEEIDDYINSEEGADKAASYAIQGRGSLYIKKISGDYFNVVGLPIYRLREMLEKLGVKP